MMRSPRTTINVAIRTDLKARFDFFIAWLKRYHPNDSEGSMVWTQNTAMDAVLSNSDLWIEYLKGDAI